MSAPPAAPPPAPGGAPDAAANPWPGLVAYTEGERNLFFGRERESGEVLRMIRREVLTVLFGRSGSGKSSLLRAGVMPRLREAACLPVLVRVDHGDAAPAPAAQIRAALAEAAAAAGVELEGAEAAPPDATLWEFFHAVAAWGPRNDPVTPVLILDQFEEVFTLGRGRPRAEAFLEELADLAENRMPRAVQERLDAAGARLPFDPHAQTYGLVLALREDFVPRLDSLRPAMPAVMRNRYALLPLDGARALQVVLGAGAAWVAEDVARDIVAAVAGGGREETVAYDPGAEIEPAYLSVVCHELFRKMRALGRPSIARDLVIQEQRGILEGLYDRSFEGLDPKAQRFVEDRLLTASGFRASVPLAEAVQEGVPEAALDSLVDRRLLRFEDRLGTRQVELSHDLLVRIVRRSRDERRQEHALRQERERAERMRVRRDAARRRARATAILAGALAVALVATLWGAYAAFIQEHEAYCSGFTKRRGFVEPLDRISVSEVRQRPSSFRLMWRGVRWDHGRVRWKPPYRVVAVDGRLRPTTNHGIGNYLWDGTGELYRDEYAGFRASEKTRQLGLEKVCQWEYMADTRGLIAYERGLDRNGRMIWGFVYSPPDPSPDPASWPRRRIARFVGPDGFVLRVRDESAAEYVTIEYDERGFETRLAYRDGNNQPARGPRDAFGRLMEPDAQGRWTRIYSIDADGQKVADASGVCGMSFAYGADGRLRELTYLDAAGTTSVLQAGFSSQVFAFDRLGRVVGLTYRGPDGRPARHLDGNHGLRYAYDRLGQMVEIANLDAEGKPVAVSMGLASFRRAFDEQGNVVRTTYFDPAGQPCLHRDGNHGWSAEYDEQGNQVVKTWLGLDGRPVVLYGYATMRCRFDARGNPVEGRYLGADGSPILHPDGNHGWSAEYDEQGKQVVKTWLGLDGQPAALPSCGYATMRSGFDTRGNLVDVHYFGADGQPARHADGNHGWAAEYNEQGKQTALTWLGVDGAPVTLAEGYATVRREFDLRGRLLSFSYFGPSGEPVLTTNRYHRMRNQYESRGLLVRSEFFGRCGEPVLGLDGIHGFSMDYDERGRLVAESWLGLDGKPMRAAEGYATTRQEFDGQGRLLRITYRGPQGEPAANRQGWHGMEWRFDDQGGIATNYLIGLDGRPLPAGPPTGGLPVDAAAPPPPGP